MERITSDQLDYKKYELTYPQYSYTRCIPVSGNNTFTISSAGTELIIELPVRAMNLSRSILYFQIAALDTGANLSTTNNGQQQWYPADALSLFRQIQLYNRSNVYACDLYELQNYTNVIWKPFTKQSNFLTFDEALNGGAGQTAVPAVMNNSGYSRFLQPSYTNLNGLANHRHDNSLPQFTGLEPLHFYATNSVIANNGNGSFILNCEIPLGSIYDTIFAIDKDLYFNEIMQLRLVFNGTSRFVFCSTGADLTNPTLTPAAAGFNVTIQNLTLWLATEDNIGIENELKAKVHSADGYSLLIPYVYTNKLGLPASSSQSVSVRYNRGHGLRLKKCIYAPYNTQESLNTVYDHSNVSSTGVAGSKISNFYTTLDNERLQQFNVDCTNASGQAQDWLQMAPYCKGSVICSSNQFQYNFFWVDDFTRIKAPGDIRQLEAPDENLIEGLDLSNEKKYDMFFTCNNAPALNHYLFAITEKLMVVNSNGIQVG